MSLAVIRNHPSVQDDLNASATRDLVTGMVRGLWQPAHHYINEDKLWVASDISIAVKGFATTQRATE